MDGLQKNEKQDLDNILKKGRKEEGKGSRKEGTEGRREDGRRGEGKVRRG